MSEFGEPLDEFPDGRMPLSYWLDPRCWPTEVRWQLYSRGWKTYCHVHDVCHWRWTHRDCCAKNHAAGLAVVSRLLGDWWPE